MKTMIVLVALCTSTIKAQPYSSGRQIYNRPIRYPEGTVNSSEDIPEAQCTIADGSQGICKPISNCVFQFENLQELEHSSCLQSNDEYGVCCPKRSSPSGSVSIPTPKVTVTVVIPAITQTDINDSGQRGIQHVQDVQKLESELMKRGLTVKKGTAESFHQAFFGSKKTAQKLSRDAQIGIEATVDIYKKFQLTPAQSRDGLSQVGLYNSILGSVCPETPSCPSSKYRTMDGSCNNIDNPTWGKSFTSFQRFLLPKYADGVTLPKIASDGGPLPSARAVSASSIQDADIPHNMYTLMVMQWAQFLDHDLTVAALTKASNGEGIMCCDPEIQRNPRLRHPECFEIDVPADDYFYSKYGQNCMEFVRSAPAPRASCTLGPREQLNQRTAFIDGSQIYGSTKEDSTNLRSFSGGRLKVMHMNSGQFLPRETSTNEDCVKHQSESFCFMAGDDRVNEQIDLTVMHTIWLREHNRVADTLATLNPYWTDETIFHEARRIVIAELQHITYNEFLPLLLGRRSMRAFGLLLKSDGYSQDYNPTVNPSIANGFATAAYRYGHTLVQGRLNMVENDGLIENEVKLSSQFFNPMLIYQPGNLDKFLRGLTTQPSQTYDSFVTNQITNHLFQQPGKHFGLDLIALNIQRGRDHAIPGYTQWRELCGLKKITSFDDLSEVMNANTVNVFRQLYRNVEDIDLFPAGVAEYSLPEATLGPTFACIVSEQFRRLKVGDRFFYENGGLPHSFSKDQLKELRRANLARIICDNSDAVNAVQPLIFVQEKSWNPVKSCSSNQIPKINLQKWSNEPV